MPLPRLERSWPEPSSLQLCKKRNCISRFLRTKAQISLQVSFCGLKEVREKESE